MSVQGLLKKVLKVRKYGKHRSVSLYGYLGCVPSGIQGYSHWSRVKGAQLFLCIFTPFIYCFYLQTATNGKTWARFCCHTACQCIKGYPGHFKFITNFLNFLSQKALTQLQQVCHMVALSGRTTGSWSLRTRSFDDWFCVTFLSGHQTLSFTQTLYSHTRERIVTANVRND